MLKQCLPLSLSLVLFSLSMVHCNDGEIDSEFDVPQIVIDFSTIMNDHREDEGCDRLEWYDPLYPIALGHSDDMRDRDFFAHENPDGESPFDRMANAGISYSSAGENIALGQTTAEQVFESWINSSGHRANIENCNFTHHALGWNEENYWTHKFVGNPSTN